MTVTLTTTPPYALTGNLPVTVAATTGNFARVWVTDAPEGSALAKLLEPADAGRVATPTLTINSGETGVQKFDKPGVYTFAVQEITRGANATFGGGYENDPLGYTTEVNVGGEQTVKVYIGARMTLRVGNPALGYAELVVYVWDDTVRATSQKHHTEKTPVVINPTTVIAEAAIGDATLATALTAMLDTTVTSWTTDFVTLFTELRDDIGSHFDQAGVHANDDTVNDAAIDDLPADPVSPEGWARSVAILARAVRNHFTNDGDAVSGGSRYHEPADYENLVNLLVPPPTGASMATSFAALASIQQAYEAHRDDTTYHALADSTNVIGTAAGELLDVHAAFLGAMGVLLPTAANTQNPGTVRLAGLGFTRG